MAETREERVALGQAMSPKKKITRLRSMGFKIKPCGELGSGLWSAASRPCRILLGVELAGSWLLRPMKQEADSSFVQITGNRTLSLSLSRSFSLSASIWMFLWSFSLDVSTLWLVWWSWLAEYCLSYILHISI